MRHVGLLALAVVMVVSCSQSPTGSSSTASAARPAASSTAVAKACAPAEAYGLLLSPGKLELVDPKGCVQATAQVGPASTHDCGSGIAAVLAPPVSASDTKVYFRDGDTNIRSITPSGLTADVTTVPGGPNVVSSFAVSPDNLRIAVVVEDFSALPAIGLQLYVEDLIGHGHHVVTYTTTFDARGPNLWPLGWHQSSLVLLVVPACSQQQVANPIAWHVVDAGTAVRQVSVGSSTCIPGWWPMPDMLSCYDIANKKINVYNWSGAIGGMIAIDPGSPTVGPAGYMVAVSNGGGVGDTSPTTVIRVASTGGVYQPLTVKGAAACLWIDQFALLAPGAVIQNGSGAIIPQTPGSRCAGRFPGAL
jgi:hypothetical protein